MSQPRTIAAPATLMLVITGLLLFAGNASASPQTADNLVEMKAKVQQLQKEQKFTEMLPLLEKLVVAEPKVSEHQFLLGFALIAQAHNTKEESTRRALHIRARNAFLKAKELGNDQPLVDALIQSLPLDGADASNYSANAEANVIMIEAEAFFSQGKLDEAFKDYQKALALDPKIYTAALYSGDVFTHKGDYANAEIWYQKAIAINPNRETAYRYSATPLMKQGKTEAARDRYIEAFITEPYSRFSVSGLTQWGQVTNTSLAHPRIDIPTNVTFDEKGDAKINLDANTLMGDKNDGSFAWLSYGTTRSLWRKEKFAKTFPSETTYRHSLPEEAEALRSVVVLATSDKKVTNLNPSLEKLKQLNEDGLLEAYILMARPDAGIALDHPAYLAANRDKLRQYVLKYVIGNRGE
jgi:tetratricopeptide (TPR) repeat protein